MNRNNDRQKRNNGNPASGQGSVRRAENRPPQSGQVTGKIYSKTYRRETVVSAKKKKKVYDTDALKHHISDQNPSNRRLRQAMKPAEVERLRRSNKREQYRIKEERQHVFRQFLGRALCTVLVYLILLGLVFGVFVLTLHIHSSPDTDDYIYQIGIDSDPDVKKSTVPWDSVYINGERYVNFTQIADLCSFITVGSEGERRFITPGGDTVDFYLDTSLAYVNGVVTRLSNFTIMKNNSVYVPLAFAEKYIGGMTVAYDEEAHKITVGRNGQPDKRGEMVYEDVDFVVKAPTPSENIPVSSLTYDILSRTIMLRNEDSDNSEGMVTDNAE